jgi:hypothetical protein
MYKMLGKKRKKLRKSWKISISIKMADKRLKNGSNLPLSIAKIAK